MRTEYYVTLLLLSFFLLLAGCKGKEESYTTLGESGQWEQVLQISGDRFSSEHRIEDLYWMARAHWEQGQVHLGKQAITLYYALAYEEEITVEARRLAILLLDGPRAIEEGRILEEQGQMDGLIAASYYEALMSQGLEGEANRIFVRYLSDTLDPRSYAQLLLRTNAESEVVWQALSPLDDSDAIALLWEAAQVEREGDYSASLAAVAAGYEQRSLSSSDRLLLYAALSRFYAMADLRVLSNKYRSLSQGL